MTKLSNQTALEDRLLKARQRRLRARADVQDAQDRHMQAHRVCKIEQCGLRAIEIRCHAELSRALAEENAARAALEGRS